MTLALAEAGLPPEAIDYVAYHGTSTALNDRVETRAARRAFGRPPRRVIPGSSIKSMIGHPQGACGAAGARGDAARDARRVPAADDQPRGPRSRVRPRLRPEPARAGVDRARPLQLHRLRLEEQRPRRLPRVMSFLVPRRRPSRELLDDPRLPPERDAPVARGHRPGPPRGGARRAPSCVTSLARVRALAPPGPHPRRRRRLREPSPSGSARAAPLRGAPCASTALDLQWRHLAAGRRLCERSRPPAVGGDAFRLPFRGRHLRFRRVDAVLPPLLARRESGAPPEVLRVARQGFAVLDLRRHLVPTLALEVMRKDLLSRARLDPRRRGLGAAGVHRRRGRSARPRRDADRERAEDVFPFGILVTGASVSGACDAVVVGAGPAGSAAAAVLARRRPPRHRPREGPVSSPQGVRRIPVGRRPREPRRVWTCSPRSPPRPRRSSAASICLPGGRAVAFDLPARGFGISRARLDDLLAGRAARLGAEVRFGARVLSIAPGTRRLVPGARRRAGRAGRDAARARRRRRLGPLGRPRSQARPRASSPGAAGSSAGAATRCAPTRSVPGGPALPLPRRLLRPLADRGRRGPSRRRDFREGTPPSGAGMGGGRRPRAPGATAALDRDLAALEPRGGPGEFLGNGPVIFTGKPPVEDGALMAGDAAGVIDPFLGEGMATALASGILAGETIERGLRRRDLARGGRPRLRAAWRRGFSSASAGAPRSARLMLHPDRRRARRRPRRRGAGARPPLTRLARGRGYLARSGCALRRLRRHVTSPSRPPA